MPSIIANIGAVLWICFLSEISARCVEKIRGDFDHPIGVCTNSKGDVIVADTSNNIIKVYNNGRVTNKFGTDLKVLSLVSFGS